MQGIIYGPVSDIQIVITGRDAMPRVSNNTIIHNNIIHSNIKHNTAKHNTVKHNPIKHVETRSIASLQPNIHFGYVCYFFILNPNIIDTQPLAGVSPGWLKDVTLTTSFSCWLDCSLKSHVLA
jgi:hypothetical protein